MGNPEFNSLGPVCLRKPSLGDFHLHLDPRFHTFDHGVRPRGPINTESLWLGLSRLSLGQSKLQLGPTLRSLRQNLLSRALEKLPPAPVRLLLLPRNCSADPAAGASTLSSVRFPAKKRSCSSYRRNLTLSRRSLTRYCSWASLELAR